MRASFHNGTAGTAEVVQETHFYPYGLRYFNDNNFTLGGHLYNNFLYTGKEWQEQLAYYDFGARMYEPALGRWNSQDPMYQYNSPYTFCGNSPGYVKMEQGLR